MKERVSILIADSDSLVCYGLTHLLDGEGDIRVLGEACNDDDMLLKHDTLKPDVTLLGMEEGSSTGVTGLRALREVSPAARVIAYTSCTNVDHIKEVASIGVDGYLLKNSRLPKLAAAIRAVGNGEVFVDAAIAAKLFEHMRYGSRPPPRHDEVLSQRECQVLHLMARGKRNRNIADELSISERTVKFHVSAILSKLRVQNRTEAVLIAFQRELIDDRDLLLSQKD